MIAADYQEAFFVHFCFFSENYRRNLTDLRSLSQAKITKCFAD
ncbi:MAG: hypothetical protein GQF41_2187 [Candidatus Rifleibacterium amylolyticum]|nr:MAG: hypothetical protein GQF41_2187 [Candidatus Rifleibacterium amylolyticum]